MLLIFYVTKFMQRWLVSVDLLYSLSSLKEYRVNLPTKIQHNHASTHFLNTYNTFYVILILKKIQSSAIIGLTVLTLAVWVIV